MRVHLMRFDGAWDDEPPIFRLVESDGRLCELWLPDEYPRGPLDGGGFDSRNDALAFKLGVDYERALHGLIPGVTVADVDRERAQLDQYHAKPERPLSGAEEPDVVYRRRVA